MLEIKLFNNYLKKSIFFLIFILLYQALPLVFLIKNTIDFERSNLFTFYLFKNFDIFVICLFLYPSVLRKIKGNDFYKNYLLKNQNFYKSSLIIFGYFFALLFAFFFIKTSIHYLIGSTIVSKPLILKTDFPLMTYGDISLLIGASFFGQLLSNIKIKRTFVFYIVFVLILIVLFSLFTFFGALFLNKFETNPAQRGSVNRTISAFYWIKTILIFLPLSSYFIAAAVAQLGLGFKGLFDYNEQIKKFEGPFANSTVLNTWLAIWFIVLPLVYLILTFGLIYLNSQKVILFKNRLFFSINKKRFKM